MGRRSRVLAIVQAGGQGSRMDVLTRERAKPALPFAGGYRLIDFVLSTIAHSAVEDVWLSVQYQASSLDPHVAGGRPWDLDRTRGGFRRVVPEEGGAGGASTGFAHGNADDLLRIRDDIERHGAEVVVVASADHVFGLDLDEVVDSHLDAGADATLVTAEVGRSEASHQVCLEVARDGRVRGVEVKPSRPTSTTVATEITLYRTERLLWALDTLRARLAGQDGGAGDGGDGGGGVGGAEGQDSGLGDLGEHLLPLLIEHGSVRAHPIGGYWRDVGRPEAYLAAHRDFLAGRVEVLGDRDRPVLTRSADLPPALLRDGLEVVDSVVGAGSTAAGRIVRSVVGPGCLVQPGAVVEDAVLFSGVVVEAGAEVRTAIVDSGSLIGRGARVGAAAPSTRPRDKDITLVGRDSRVGRGARVAPGARLEPGSTA